MFNGPAKTVKHTISLTLKLVISACLKKPLAVYIEALTKRVILIGKGRVLLDGSFNGLIKKYSLTIIFVG